MIPLTNSTSQFLAQLCALGSIPLVAILTAPLIARLLTAILAAFNVSRGGHPTLQVPDDW